jgi:hypothetical protein
MVASLPILTLVYMPDDAAAEMPVYAGRFQQLLFRTLPFKRQDIVDAFVAPRMSRPRAAPRAAPAATSRFVCIEEAVQHLKTTVGMLQALATSATGPEATRLVQAIGQRFNGLYGTFLFFGERSGYRQLRRLCEIVDAVGKTYEREADRQNVAAVHAALLLRAARCAFAVLKEMRHGQPITPALEAEATAIDTVYQAATDLFHREPASQDLVDELLGEKKSA